MDEQRNGYLSIRARRDTFTVRMERPSQELAVRAIVSGNEAEQFAARRAQYFTAPTCNTRFNATAKATATGFALRRSSYPPRASTR